MLPSEGWDLDGVGQNEGESEAKDNTEDGTWTPSIQIGWEFTGS